MTLSTERGALHIAGQTLAGLADLCIAHACARERATTGG